MTRLPFILCVCVCVFVSRMGSPWFLYVNVKGDSPYLIWLINVSLKVINVGDRYLLYTQGPVALAHLCATNSHHSP